MSDLAALKPYNITSGFAAAVPEDVSMFGALLLRDEALANASDLERHFNDLYHLFLNKFARLSHMDTVSEAEEKAMKDLLNELLFVKQQLGGE